MKKLILIITASFFISSAANAECFCACVNGEHVPVCTGMEMPVVVCGWGVCMDPFTD